MKVLALIALLFASVSAESVLTLTSDNFDQTIEQHPLILVEFYAPWCGHCKRLEPEYEKAAQELEGVAPLAKVDADDEQNKPLASRFEIRGFPTLKVFRNGVPSDYNGERSADSIVSYMKKQTMPAISSLSSVEEVNDFSKKDKVVIVGFFDNEDSDEYKSFKDLSESLRDKFIFGAVVGQAAVNKELNVNAPHVTLYKSFDEGKNEFEGSFDGLKDFITKNSIPLIDEIGPENYQSYIESGLPLGYLFVDLQVEGQLEENLGHIKDVAKETKGKINWVYIDWSKYAKHSERLGLSGSVVPSLAIELEGKHWAYDETAPFNKEALSEWIRQYAEGKVDATIKSEPIPEPNDDPVKVAVAKNFESLVLDSSKDVLVEFYAPWCGHCKQLAPTYEELGKTFQGIDSVVIAKMDATANDVDPKYDVRGFPTIKLFTADDKENPIDYEGDRSHDDMAKFIKEKSSKSFTLDSSKDVKEGKDEL